MPKMTIAFTRYFQAAMFLIGFVLPESATLFGWSPALVTWLTRLLQGLQVLQANEAHKFNQDGTKPGEVPQKTITTTIPQPGEGPTVTTAVTEPVTRKGE